MAELMQANCNGKHSISRVEWFVVHFFPLFFANFVSCCFGPGLIFLFLKCYCDQIKHYLCFTIFRMFDS